MGNFFSSFFGIPFSSSFTFFAVAEMFFTDFWHFVLPPLFFYNNHNELVFLAHALHGNNK
tara:strand:+ start:432 stop:611 length:180 start_codon:yes stop_codon:yes gene_type:complete